MSIVLEMRTKVAEAKSISFEGSAVVMSFRPIPENPELEAQWAGYEMSLEDQLLMAEWQAECDAVAAGIAKEREIAETDTKNERVRS